MSIWTHINGSIRVDGVVMRGDSSRMLEGLKVILGNICSFDDKRDKWNKCTVPCGSEGSLQYHIHEYGTGLAWAVVVIYGDLRDYSNVKEISTWFESVCIGWPMIRQAILEIEVEGQETCILRFANNKLSIIYRETV